MSDYTIPAYTDREGPLVIRSERWTQDALCAETDPEAFFPEKGGSIRAAVAVCARCEVREKCLEWAIRTNPEWGIYGGKSITQVKNLIKKQAS